MRNRIIVLLSLLMTASTLPLGLGAFAQELPPPYLAALEERFRDYELQVMEGTMMKRDLADGEVTLTFFGEPTHLKVAPASFDATLSTATFDEEGNVIVTPATFEVAVYVGEVVGEHDSSALVVVTEAGVSGNVQREAGTIVFEPLSFTDDNAPAGLSVAYRIQDIVQQDLPHGHQAIFAESGSEASQPPAIPGSHLGAGPTRRITLWADMQMVQSSASWVSIISSAFATMNAEYGKTSGTYPGWGFVIANNIIYYCDTSACQTTWGMTSSDPYVLLPAWGNQVPNNAPVGTNFDVAYLSSGKSFSGGILGLGYQPGRYSLGKMPGLSAWSQALLMGHEVGHNFNGDHGNRGTPSPGRATSSSHDHGFNHVHTYDHCHTYVPATSICLENHQHNDNHWHSVWYTHYTLMWPSLVGTSGTNEQFFDLGTANQNWMRDCNANSHSGGAYAAGSGSGWGFYCLN